MKGNAKLNVNELLVEKKFCIVKTSPQILSVMPDISFGANSNLRKENPALHTPVKNTIVYEEKSPQQRKPIVTTEEILKRNRDRSFQMEEKKKETTQVIDKECQDLLNLLHGGSSLYKSNSQTTNKVTDYGVSSGTSDFSDIESTPLPKSASYKSGERYSGQMRSQVGENILAKVLGIQSSAPVEEKPALNKLDSFLSECSQPFEIIDDTDDIQVGSRGSSHLAIPSQIMRAIGSGKKAGKDTLQLDVLVYGKEKRSPLKHLEDLTLPDQILPGLKSLNFDKPSQFQMNVWPAILALKNVVGIADNYSSEISRILAYILPLIKILITDQILYSELGGGNGVNVILNYFIFVSSHQKKTKGVFIYIIVSFLANVDHMRCRMARSATCV